MSQSAHGSATPDLTAREAFILVPLAFICVWIGVYPQPFIDRLKPEVTALGQKFERMIVIPQVEQACRPPRRHRGSLPVEPPGATEAD